MVDLLSMVSKFSYVISLISLAAAIFCWFHFSIPSVYNDLSGKTAKKSIAQMIRMNEEKQKQEKPKFQSVPKQENERLDTSVLSETVYDESSETETIALDQGNETVLLNETKKRSDPYVENRNIEFKMIDEVMMIHTNEMID
ncbi:MAG: hypothetical protein HFF01_00490 [Erysipelotrichaceae bacterium]|nr:hypothetical protein [Erysipelotrichaceae bacterium]